MGNEFRTDVPPIAAPTGEVGPRPAATQDKSLQKTTKELLALARWHDAMLGMLIFSVLTDLALLYYLVNDVEKLRPGAQETYILAVGLAFLALVGRCLTVFKVVQTLGDPRAVVVAILSAWSLIGFFVMVSLNNEARKKLRASGLQVGFWGVHWKKLSV